jgi:hypothetical protein
MASANRLSQPIDGLYIDFIGVVPARVRKTVNLFQSHRMLLSALAAGVVAGGSLLAPLTAAHAEDAPTAPVVSVSEPARSIAPVIELLDEICFVCGKVYNWTGSKDIKVADNWCHSGTSYSGETMGCSNTSERTISPGQNSGRHFNDTDAVRIPGGCIFRVRRSDLGENAPYTDVDRRGRGPQWLKVSGTLVSVSFPRC